MADIPEGGTPIPGVEPGEGEAELEEPGKPTGAPPVAGKGGEAGEVVKESDVVRNFARLNEKLQEVQCRLDENLGAGQASQIVFGTAVEEARGDVEAKNKDLMGAHTQLGTATGYINGIRHAIQTLKSEDKHDQSDPTVRLNELIDAQKGRMVDLARRLVGDEQATTLLADTETLLGSTPHVAVSRILNQAGGLVLKLKDIDEAIIAKEGEVRRASIGFAPVEERSADQQALDKLKGDKRLTEEEGRSLLTQIIAALRVVAVLEESVASTEGAAAFLEGQLEDLESEVGKARSTCASAEESLRVAQNALLKKQLEMADAGKVVEEIENKLSPLRALLDELASVPDTLRTSERFIADSIAERGGVLCKGLSDIYTNLQSRVHGTTAAFSESPVSIDHSVLIRVERFSAIQETRIADTVGTLFRTGKKLEEMFNALAETIAKEAQSAEDCLREGEGLSMSGIEQIMTGARAVMTEARDIQRFIDSQLAILPVRSADEVKVIADATSMALDALLGDLKVFARFANATPDTRKRLVDMIDDDGTGSVDTPHDPLPVVGSGDATTDAGADDGDDPVEIELDLDPDADDVTEEEDVSDAGAAAEAEVEPEDVTATEAGASTEPTVDSPATTPKRKKGKRVED